MVRMRVAYWISEATHTKTRVHARAAKLTPTHSDALIDARAHTQLCNNAFHSNNDSP